MKKISQILAYTVLGVLVVGIILCSILKISFKPEMSIPMTAEAGTVQIKTTQGTAQIESSNENIGIEKFAQKFNEAFELTVLNSLFSGRIGSELKREKLGFIKNYVMKDENGKITAEMKVAFGKIGEVIHHIGENEYVKIELAYWPYYH